MLRSRFLHPSNAIALGADGSFNNCTAIVTRNEIEAVAALLVSVRPVLILHRLLRSLLLRKRFLASNHACSQRRTGQQRSCSESRAAREFRTVIHRATSFGKIHKTAGHRPPSCRFAKTRQYHAWRWKTIPGRRKQLVLAWKCGQQHTRVAPRGWRLPPPRRRRSSTRCPAGTRPWSPLSR